MCIYISAIVPKNADLPRLSEIAASFKKDLQPFKNASIQKFLNPNESLFLTTRGHCDCDSAIGSSRSTRRKLRDIDEERLKLAKKGWSHGKIERSLAQRMEQILKREEDQNSQAGKDLENWLGFLLAALGMGKAPYVGLLTHHYSGSLGAELVPISGREIISVTNVTQATLAGINEDVIYQVSAHA